MKGAKKLRADAEKEQRKAKRQVECVQRVEEDAAKRSRKEESQKVKTYERER